MKTSDLFARALANEGVEYVFGIPGEENLDLLESLRSSPISLVVARHEQAAGFMAATYGRLTGKTGVCLSTLGPGATNFVTSVSHALLGGMPVLFITGQKPIKTSKQGRFQILDVVRLMEPITKFSRQIVDGNNVPHLIREAFRTAEAEKPGPVHLELPEDVACEQVDRVPFPVTEQAPADASHATLEYAARLVMQARHPLLLVGAGANRHRTHDVLRDFVDRTGLYFVTTQMGKGVVDERHPQFLGTAALSSNDYLHSAIDHADLIVNIGHDVSEKPPFVMREQGPQVIHLAYSPAQIDDVYYPQHEVVGCTAANLRMLASLIQPSPRWDLAYFGRVREDIERHVYAHCDAADFPPLPQRIVSDVRRAMPSDGIVSLDTGLYKIWFARNYRAHEPNSILLDNALATMGAGLPAAIAAKLVHPGRRVLAVCGDGGFMMNSQELETARRLGLDLTVVILRDDAYGMIKWKQTRTGRPSFGVDFGNPDFVRYAQSYGAHGLRIGATAELLPALADCLATRGVHVVEVPIDYGDHQAALMDGL